LLNANSTLTIFEKSSSLKSGLIQENALLVRFSLNFSLTNFSNLRLMCSVNYSIVDMNDFVFILFIFKLNPSTWILRNSS
jgi:hypothetical protein